MLDYRDVGTQGMLDYKGCWITSDWIIGMLDYKGCWVTSDFGL